MDFELPKDLVAYLDRARRLHRAGDPTSRGGRRQHPLLRPPPRGRPHRLGPGRAAQRTSGRLCSREARRRADAAGHYRYPFPAEYGGRDGTNLGMAVIREHLAAKGLGLHCDLQNEHAIVGNNVGLLLMIEYGSEAQRAEWIDGLAERYAGASPSASPNPPHGTDATYMETHAERDGDGWVINGEKTWNTGIHAASHDLIFARTSGQAGRRARHHRLPRADGHARVQGRGVPVDVQHAHRPRTHLASPTSACPTRHLRRRGPRLSRGAALLQREPHPPSRIEPRRGPVLHQRVGRLRQGPKPVRHAPGARTRPSSSRSSSCRRSATCSVP